MPRWTFAAFGWGSATCALLATTSTVYLTLARALGHAMQDEVR